MLVHLIETRPHLQRVITYPKQECIPVGWVGVSALGVSTLGGVCLQGVSARGVCLPGGCLARGFTPPSCGQTDTSKNITFPQLLLRTVKTKPHEIENILMCLLGEGEERKGHS